MPPSAISPRPTAFRLFLHSPLSSPASSTHFNSVSQVWFQNRRAKTKQQAKKAEAAVAAGGTSNNSPNPDDMAVSDPAALATALDDDDDEPKDEDALSPALPPSPLPPQQATDETASEQLPASAPSDLMVKPTEGEQVSVTPESRRGSIAPPPLPAWATSPASGSSTPAISSAAPTMPPQSALTSPDPMLPAHTGAPHMRNPSAPAPPNAYPHSHIASADLYAQRRTSLPVSSLSAPHAPGRISNMGGLRRYDPSIRRRSTDMGRLLAHPYAHIAGNANGQNHAGLGTFPEGEEAAHPPQPLRRPPFMPRSSMPFLATGPNRTMQLGPHPNAHPHALTHPLVPTQQGPHPQLAPRQYDISPIQVASPHTPHAFPGMQDYSLFPRHSIDGSALGLSQAHPHMSHASGLVHALDDPVAATYHASMDMGGGIAPHDPRPYAISQRPLAPPVPGPLPSPNFQFGNPFAPTTTTAGSGPSSAGASASGTPPHGTSPSLLALPRRASEGGASDADTEESSSGGQLSRFGSVASLGAGSEVSYTSAFTSDGGHVEADDLCASRRASW